MRQVFHPACSIGRRLSWFVGARDNIGVFFVRFAIKQFGSLFETKSAAHNFNTATVLSGEFANAFAASAT